MTDETRVYQEWRLTADHVDPEIFGVAPYVFTWSAWSTPHICVTNEEAESAAKSFAGIAHRSLKNLKLTSRTVTVTPWSEETLTREPESLESLAARSSSPVESWQYAFNALGDRENWPEITEWVIRNSADPRWVADVLIRTEVRKPLTDEDLDQLIANTAALRENLEQP